MRTGDTNDQTPDNERIVEITKRFKFEAAHQLPYHDGKCSRLHGHSYVVDVSVQGPVRPDNPQDPESGMVMDFYRLGDVMKPLISEMLDHHSLNEIFNNPTAEKLCLYLYDVLTGVHSLPVSRVRVYETADGWVEYTPR